MMICNYNLLLNVLGKGRFGKVMKASAYCIVPQMPSVNMVAVKTANSSE